MSKKILVTTDLSPAAKAGIRFGIQLASQNGHSLVFLHVLEILKPTRWSETRYEAYVREETEAARVQLERAVLTEFRAARISSGEFQCVVAVQNISVHNTIIRQATKMKADYICMSTRGAGGLKKLLGTNASILLTTSPVPVFVVPRTWRRSPIKKIFYSSDFNDLGRELKKVKSFADSINVSTIDVFHYDYLLNVKENLKRLEKVAARHKASGVMFNFRKQNIEESLSYRLNIDVRKSKSSIAVLFTKQNRGWYERLFLSSRSAELSFISTVPLLVFRKGSA